MFIKSLIIEENNCFFWLLACTESIKRIQLPTTVLLKCADMARVHSKKALASELLTKSLTCFYYFYFSGNILHIPYSIELTTRSTLLERGSRVAI